MEVLVLCWNIEVFVFSIAECAVLSVTEIINVVIRIDQSVELTACCDSYDFFAF
jgi:hypothetical protein